MKIGHLHDRKENCYVLKMNILELEIFFMYYFWGCFMYPHSDEVPSQTVLVLRFCKGGIFNSADPKSKAINLGVLQFYQYDARFIHSVSRVIGIRFSFTFNKTIK